MAANPNNGGKRTKAKGGASGAVNKARGKRSASSADPKGKAKANRGATGNQAKVTGQGKRPVSGTARGSKQNGQSTKKNVRTPR